MGISIIYSVYIYIIHTCTLYILISYRHMASESAAYLRLAMNMVVCIPRPGGRLPLQIGVKPAVVIPIAVGVVLSHPTIDTVTINPSVTLVISPTYLWPLHCVLGHGRFRCSRLPYGQFRLSYGQFGPCTTETRPRRGELWRGSIRREHLRNL